MTTSGVIMTLSYLLDYFYRLILSPRFPAVCYRFLLSLFLLSSLATSYGRVVVRLLWLTFLASLFSFFQLLSSSDLLQCFLNALSFHAFFMHSF
jgi:hypothetical protein